MKKYMLFMTSLGITMLILLFACGGPPEMTPANARAYGVGVQDGDTVTGTVTRRHYVSLQTTEEVCGPGAGGCYKPEIPSPNHEYEIWYADAQCIKWHEEYHVGFESRHHTADFNVRIKTDWLAACPRKGKERTGQ